MENKYLILDIFNNLKIKNNYEYKAIFENNKYIIECLNIWSKEKKTILINNEIIQFEVIELLGADILIVLFLKNFSVYNIKENILLDNHDINLNENILTCFKVFENNIYIGTSDGLYFKYDIETKKLENFLIKNDISIVDLFMIKKELYFISENCEIIDSKKKIFKFRKDDLMLPLKSIQDYSLLDETIIIIGMSDGSIFIIEKKDDFEIKANINAHLKEISSLFFIKNSNTNYFELLSSSYDGYLNHLIIKIDNREYYEVESKFYKNLDKKNIVGIHYDLKDFKIYYTNFNNNMTKVLDLID